MKLRPTPKFVLAFVALLFGMHEAHEIVHTTVGRIICGCWGLRDFNVWELCTGCSDNNPISVMATFAGPAFSFLIMWVGASLLRSDRTVSQKSIGFSLVFANMPFARILTTTMGGGDEVYGLNVLLNNYSLAWALGLGIVIMLCSIPLYVTYKAIKNERRIGWFLLFLVAPVVIDVVVVLLGLNTMLQNGILDQYWILGSPMLVTLWTFLVFASYILMRKHLSKLGVKLMPPK